MDRPLNPLRVLLGAGATFVARTVATDLAHMGQVLEAAARHKGAAVIEILQNCKVFNDGAFDAVSGREQAEESRLVLEHGRPLVFGPGRRKAIVVRNMDPTVVDLDQQPVDEREILVHDAQANSPALAAMLASLEPPEFPMAVGVFRAVELPTYDHLLFDQIHNSVARRGKGDLHKLLNSGTTWEVS